MAVEGGKEFLSCTLNGKKRSRVDSNDPAANSPESKRVCAEPPESDRGFPYLERVKTDVSGSDTKLYRVEADLAESGPNSYDSDRVEPDLAESDEYSPAAVNGIPSDLLDIIDDSDIPEIVGLESLIKSFEYEILQHPPPPPPEERSAGTDLGLGEHQPDLGYLLEASDDDLGLPPSESLADLVEAVESGQFGGDEMMERDEYPFGNEDFDDWRFVAAVDEVWECDGSGGQVVLEEEEEELLWRPESMPAT